MRKLLRNKAKYNINGVAEDSSAPQFQEFYMKDSTGGFHLVVVKDVEVDANGRLQFSYTSSSDLEKYGLVDHLREMVSKYYWIDGGSVGSTK